MGVHMSKADHEQIWDRVEAGESLTTIGRAIGTASDHRPGCRYPSRWSETETTCRMVGQAGSLVGARGDLARPGRCRTVPAIAKRIGRR